MKITGKRHVKKDVVKKYVAIDIEGPEKSGLKLIYKPVKVINIGDIAFLLNRDTAQLVEITSKNLKQIMGSRSFRGVLRYIERSLC